MRQVGTASCMIIRASLVISLLSSVAGAAIEARPSMPVSMMDNGVLPGCAGDGKQDDTACLQGWIDKRQGGVLNLGTGLYLVSSPLVSKGAITLIGGGGGRGIYKQSCTSGLRSNNPKQDILVIHGGGSRIYNLCIDANVQMESGTAISILGSANSVIIADSHINNQITSIAVSGTGLDGATQNADVVLRHNTIVPAAHANAVGIAIGRNSMKANTVDTRIDGNSLVCQKQLGIGTLIADSGGALIRNNTQYGCAIGTKVFPGAGQMVAWLYFSNTVLGDTDADHNLVIDTQDSTASVWGLNFTGTWASNADGASVLIQDSAASHNILGVHFIGHRTYMARDQSGFLVRSGQKITFDAGTICSDGKGKGTGFVVTGDAMATAVRNSTIGSCDHNAAGQLASGIAVQTKAANVGVFTGNDLGNSTTPIVWAPAARTAVDAVVGQNLGLDTAEGAAVVSERVNLPLNHAVVLSGTGTIKWLDGGWAAREVELLAKDGAIAFEVGGNLCNPLRLEPRQAVTALYRKSLACWSVK